MTNLKVIDLYSGIGGWTLGLKLAGLDVIDSYEWWSEANFTHNMNFETELEDVDIREMSFDSLPKPGTVDFVVGSPPCTQFSFSNRGGGGDIVDGLKDIYKFLEIVEYLKPRHWVMENVPRVAGILKKELARGGQLKRFNKLNPVITTVNMANFGLPQSRKRTLAGNFPLDVLESYVNTVKHRTLGDVIRSLNQDPVTDPIYNIQISKEKLTDNKKEAPLNREEERMNREAKEFHPVYNIMQFPDPLDKPARTITATCTRVSRESTIIRDEENGGALRRLSARERAVLQSFPITFQFYGKSYSSRLKMIGNAFPPLMAFYVAHCLLGTDPKKLLSTKKTSYSHQMPKTPPKVKIDSEGKHYPLSRRFRAAIPNLRFGSGMRFELVNSFDEESISWSVGFYYGSSKDIRTISLDWFLFNESLSLLDSDRRELVSGALMNMYNSISNTDRNKLQKVWVGKEQGIHPHDVVDQLGNAIDIILEEFNQVDDETISTFILTHLNPLSQNNQLDKHQNGNAKIERYSKQILAGFVIGSSFNTQESFRALNQAQS
ncbi:MAG: DNA (cytosine-5-)-methyltransferase [bacterium]|nr:DNA (cytosine-5-)-methyltransferase [bacterium]